MDGKDLLITVAGVLGLAWLLESQQSTPANQAQPHIQAAVSQSVPFPSIAPKPQAMASPPLAPVPQHQNVSSQNVTPQLQAQQDVVTKVSGEALTALAATYKPAVSVTPQSPLTLQLAYIANFAHSTGQTVVLLQNKKDGSYSTSYVGWNKPWTGAATGGIIDSADYRQVAGPFVP